jgi:hypothetical protein
MITYLSKPLRPLSANDKISEIKFSSIPNFLAKNLSNVQPQHRNVDPEA